MSASAPTCRCRTLCSSLNRTGRATGIPDAAGRGHRRRGTPPASGSRRPVPAGGSLRALPVVITAVDGARFIETTATVTDPALCRHAASRHDRARAHRRTDSEPDALCPAGAVAQAHAGTPAPATTPGARSGSASLRPPPVVIASFLVLAAGAIALRHGRGSRSAGASSSSNRCSWSHCPWCWSASQARCSVCWRSGSPASSRGWREWTVAGTGATSSPAHSRPCWRHPCSAPFVGTALGFALSAGTLEILAIFTAMGIGLAAPWLGIAAFPALVTLLPRPGR